jgi:type IV secretion system protein TrbI
MDTEPTRPDETIDPASEPTGVRGAIRDRRRITRGTLPRQAQTWIMLGLACLILVVILTTGRPNPSPTVSISPTVAQPSAVQPERVRSYQERLAEQEARIREAQAAVPITPTAAAMPTVAASAPSDPIIEERRRRDEQSLFADNVAFSRRGSGAQVGATAPASTVAPVWPYPVPSAVPTPAPAPALSSAPSNARGESHSEASSETTAGTAGPESSSLHADATQAGPQHTLLEGTAIESVLVNRLDGTFQGPVQCLVTTPVYSQDRQAVVIPAGARVLGAASPVQAWGDARLAVRFHRLLMPDGRSHSLESFTGLNQVGETGLRDQVNRHYLQVFGASLAIGAVSGLAQFGTRSGFDITAADASRQAAGASLATSTARVLDRYLNVLPTVTIREGHRIKIVLTNDLRLPTYAHPTAAGLPPPAALLSRPLTSGGSR